VIVWGPAVLLLFGWGSTWKAIFLLLWGAIAVSSSDNLIRPVLIGRGVAISTSLILVGTVGGLAAWGLIGLFIGPLVITVFQYLVEVARRDLFGGGSRPRKAEHA
jgi:predicted PurR-regulated permease PerM